MDENIPHLEATLRMTEAPGFLAPWMNRFYDAADVQLIRLAAEGRLSPEVIGRWSASKGDTAAVLRSARKRGVIDLGPDGRYTVADFHRRFEMWALFEGWKDIPPGIRVRLNAWEMDHYTAGHADQVAALRGGGPIDASRVWPRYLLLHEAETLLGRVGAVFLWPCNCRAMMKGCGKPDLTCLRFSNDRGLGWEISRERATEIARSAHKYGLMQVGEIGIGPDGQITGALCNCCADCCYPQQLSTRLEAENLWPLRRYAAVHLPDRCTACGRCVKRCPFGLFAVSGSKKNRAIQFNALACRGCGLCASACPEAAIRMDPLPSYARLVRERGYPDIGIAEGLFLE